MKFCKNIKYFCFVCGKFTAKVNKKSKTETFVKLYRLYYEQDWVDDSHVPQFGCSNCYVSLFKWKAKKLRADGSLCKPKYKEPMTWNSSSEHNEEECYFCVNFTKGMTTAKNTTTRYVATIATRLPIEHGDASPPLNLPVNQEQQDDADDNMDIDMDMDMDLESSFVQQSTSSEYVPPRSAVTNPILVNQPYLNHMARKLELSQRKSLFQNGVLILLVCFIL